MEKSQVCWQGRLAEISDLLSSYQTSTKNDFANLSVLFELEVRREGLPASVAVIRSLRVILVGLQSKVIKVCTNNVNPSQ